MLVLGTCSVYLISIFEEADTAIIDTVSVPLM